jgi:hypothetical protein
VSRSETLYLKQRIYFEKQDYKQALKIVNQLIESQTQATESPFAKRTDFSDLCYYLKLKGQVMERLGVDKQEILDV